MRYSPLEKLAYALIMSVHKLRLYFFDHSVEVLTTFSLRQVLHRSDMAGRLLKWAVEIGQFGITFTSRTTIKGHAMIDFMVKLTYSHPSEREVDQP